MNMICHDSPYLSFSQPYRSLNGYWPSSISDEPPFSSTFHSSSASPLVRQAIRNDTAGVNLKSGPADRSVNCRPARSTVTMATDPEGVPSSVVVSLTFESLNSEVYSRPASLASLSNHKCVVMVVFISLPPASPKPTLPSDEVDGQERIP